MLEVRKDQTAEEDKVYKQYLWSARYIDAVVVRWRDRDTDGNLTDPEHDTLQYSSDANMNVMAVVEQVGGGDWNVVERYGCEGPRGTPSVLHGVKDAAGTDTASDVRRAPPAKRRWTARRPSDPRSGTGHALRPPARPGPHRRARRGLTARRFRRSADFSRRSDAPARLLQVEGLAQDTDVEDTRALVIRAAGGSADQAERLAAFGDLVRRYRDMAYGYACSILGDRHLGEDAAQEAFIAAYRALPKLRDPGAFPAWLRRIVATQCARLTRRKRPAPRPLDEAAGVRARPAGDSELREQVDRAVRALPEDQRVATTLFYIDGYSQREIAEFLEVPVTTVNSRLAASRKRLKQRMLTMVEHTLRRGAPDERFDRKVIEELLGRPRLLEIADHPVRQVADAIRAALAEYEEIAGDEIVPKAGYLGSRGAAEGSYHLDADTILRPETTVVTLQAMAGRAPPIRLLASGRVFRPDPEDARDAKVFHQLEALCVDRGADAAALKATLRKALTAAVGPLDVRWTPPDFDVPAVAGGLEACAVIAGQSHCLAGGGTLTPEALRRAGLDPEAVAGFAFGIGLERLAMIRLGIDDVRELWRPPYVGR